MNKFNTMRRSAALIPFAYLLTLGLFGCGAPEATDVEEPVETEQSKFAVEVLPIQPQPFTHRFSVQGNIETDRNALLTAEFAGAIESVLVREGDEVRKGAALVKIDTDVIDKSMAEIQLQLDLAKVVFERQEELWKQKIGSEIEFLQAKTQYEGLQRSMATLLEQKDMAVVRAPFSGVVDRCMAKVGELASPAMPLVRIVNLSDMKVRAMVSDHYAGRIKEGMPAEVVVSGVDTIQTKVGRVGQYINPANRTLEITLPLPNGTGFLPNMYTSVWLEDLNLKGAIALPSSLIQQDMNGEDFVFVAVGKGSERTVEKRILKSGVGSGDLILIESGLRIGDEVISKGATRVVVGQEVSIQAN